VTAPAPIDIPATFPEKLPGAPGGAHVKVTDVGHRFAGKRGSVQALQGVNFEVQPGEFVVVVGPSGCGKSTLLTMLSGLEKPSEGTVEVDGKPVERPQRDRIMMFQEGALFPWLDALGNVEFGLREAGMPRAERRKVALEHLKEVQLQDFAEHQVHQLSGGMKQRVALARALALTPRLLLMDEPFAALDAQTRDDMLDRVQMLWAADRPTVLFVTHNVREAATLGDRVLVMSHRPGHIKETFTIDSPRPRHIEDDAVVQNARRIKAALQGELNWNWMGGEV
jgi:NitT/TauT family transport system ATP-binding protein